jgi:hypothetical protein
MLRFFHLRLRDNNDKVAPKGGCTVGYIKLIEATDDKPGTLLATFARCSNKDIFCKRKARSIVQSRFQREIYREFSFAKGADVYPILMKGIDEHEKYVQDKYDGIRRRQQDKKHVRAA